MPHLAGQLYNLLRVAISVPATHHASSGWTDLGIFFLLGSLCLQHISSSGWTWQNQWQTSGSTKGAGGRETGYNVASVSSSAF
jgi:hypothetical protein